MKYPLSAFLLVFAFKAIALDTPETIQPKTKIIRTVRWYADQAEKWKEKTNRAPASAEAWLNYYTAARYAQQTPAELDRIVAEIPGTLSGTYEALIVQSLHAGYTENSFKLLSKAYAMNPERGAAYGPLVLHHELYQNSSERKAFGERLLSSGQLSQTLLSYSYNVLMSIEKNAILFIEGDNTTLPLLVLQDVMNVRKDVVILNLDLLVTDQYRQRKLSSNEMQLSGNIPLDGDWKKFLCVMLPEQNSSRHFFYALTVGRENIAEINNQLYVVGLASQLSKERLDNISVIKENIEKRFLLDYLTVDFNGENEFAAGRVLSSNYLVSMLLLYEYYKKTGNLDKSVELEKTIQKIAIESGKETVVKNILNHGTEDSVPYFPFAINYDDIEKTVRLVGNNLYAQNHEVTNDEYNTFLRYLLDHQLKDFYEKYKFDMSGYQEPALSFMKGYSAMRIPDKKEKLKYPAVNISHESAIAYCEWLTEQYNHTAGRKYKNVKFRLPKISEWQIAAASLENPVSWNLNENSVEVKVYANGKMAGKDFTTKTVSLSDPEILYPWFRHFVYRNNPANSFGCYLGNFKIPDNVKPCQAKMTTPDGWLAMAPVETYFPNDIGLYDMVGNVAEMTDEDGKAVGGSWNHSPAESTIRSINEYKGPDSAIGFRIFMEVLEK